MWQDMGRQCRKELSRWGNSHLRPHLELAAVHMQCFFRWSDYARPWTKRCACSQALQHPAASALLSTLGPSSTTIVIFFSC